MSVVGSKVNMDQKWAEDRVRFYRGFQRLSEKLILRHLKAVITAESTSPPLSADPASPVTHPTEGTELLLSRPEDATPKL